MKLRFLKDMTLRLKVVSRYRKEIDPGLLGDQRLQEVAQALAHVGMLCVGLCTG